MSVRVVHSANVGRWPFAVITIGENRRGMREVYNLLSKLMDDQAAFRFVMLVTGSDRCTTLKCCFLSISSTTHLRWQNCQSSQQHMRQQRTSRAN